MSAGTSVELPKELWSPLSEKIDKLVDRIELIKLAVEGLHHGADVLPHDNQGAVDTVVVALDALEDELEALVVGQGRAA